MTFKLETAGHIRSELSPKKRGGGGAGESIRHSLCRDGTGSACFLKINSPTYHIIKHQRDIQYTPSLQSLFTRQCGTPQSSLEILFWRETPKFPSLTLLVQNLRAVWIPLSTFSNKNYYKFCCLRSISIMQNHLSLLFTPPFCPHRNGGL